MWNLGCNSLIDIPHNNSYIQYTDFVSSPFIVVSSNVKGCNASPDRTVPCQTNQCEKRRKCRNLESRGEKLEMFWLASFHEWCTSPSDDICIVVGDGFHGLEWHPNRRGLRGKVIRRPDWF